MIAGCVLAAGEGRRFGGIKQLADVEGRPLLAYALDVLRAAPVGRRLLVLGAHSDEIRSALQDDLPPSVEVVTCDAWGEGQSASLRTAIAASHGADGLLVLLGDQPLVTSSAARRVLSAASAEEPVRASYRGRPGHPVLLPRRLWPRIESLRGDVGAGRALREEFVLVPCEDVASDADVDTQDGLSHIRRAIATRR